MNLMSKVAAIELIEDSVHVVVVKTGTGQPEILESHRATASYENEEERFEARVAMLRTVTENIKNKPTAWVLCVSSANAVVRNLLIPFKGRKRVATAVPFELEPYLAFPLEELLLDYTVIREVEGQTEILAAGIRRDHLNVTLALMAAADIPIDGVSLDALGLTNVWMSSHKQIKGLNIVLHVRKNVVLIVISYQKRIASFRAIPINAEAIQENPATLVREVQNTIRAFSTRWRDSADKAFKNDSSADNLLFSELTITGLTEDAEFTELFSRLVQMPVKMEQYLGNFKSDVPLEVFEEGVGNVWEPIVGTTLGATGSGISLNFLESGQDWTRMLRGSITHLMFASCLALLVLVGWMVYYVKGAEKHKSAATELRSEINQLMNEIEHLESQGLPGVQTALFGDPPILDLMVEISRLMPGNRVEIVDLRMAPMEARSPWITIQGQARSVDAFNEVFTALQRSDFFRVDPNPDLTIQGEVTSFTVRLFRKNEVDHERT